MTSLQIGERLILWVYFLHNTNLKISFINYNWLLFIIEWLSTAKIDETFTIQSFPFSAWKVQLYILLCRTYNNFRHAVFYARHQLTVTCLFCHGMFFSDASRSFSRRMFALLLSPYKCCHDVQLAIQRKHIRLDQISVSFAPRLAALSNATKINRRNEEWRFVFYIQVSAVCEIGGTSLTPAAGMSLPIWWTRRQSSTPWILECLIQHQFCFSNWATTSQMIRNHLHP